MNTNQGALYFGAGIDLQQWRNNVNEMRRDILGLTNTTQQQTKQMDTSFRNIGLGLTTYFSGAALGGFVNQIINVRGEFQKTEIAFGTMLKSTDKAKELMGQMVELAAKTPFSLQDVSAGAKQLLAFQVPANEVVDTLTRMGNIAAGLGVPLSRINLVYGQVMAKGKLMGDDLRQFTEAGIPMVAELAKKFNTSTAEITKMVTAGKIGFKDVQDVLFSMTNEGGMFFNLMEKQSKSLSGQMSNLGDSFDQMLNKLGESNQNILTDGIAATAYLVDNYETVAEIIGVMVASYGAYRAALIATAALNQMQNTTIASEIKLLGISEKMKLGRAMVTQRQAEATARETAVELSGVQAKYAALQAEVSILAIKKQSAIQSGINATAKAQEAQVQLALARAELSSIQATGSARQIQIAQKNVEKAQNTAIATQESASIARKRALGAATEFNTAKQSLENTAQKVGVATKTAATAAEAAQVAAKNTNAIATTRLTVMQNIQTFATRTAASAQAFLNATLLGNPIALVIGLIAGLTYVIYKNITATTQWEELQGKLNETTKKGIDNAEEQQAKINTLIGVIKNKNTTDNQAKKALDEINRLTGNRIEGLTIEGIRTGNNTKAISGYIEMLKKEARAKALIQTITAAETNNKEIDRDNPNNLTIGERFSNFDELSDLTSFKTPQQRKQEVMLKSRMANNKLIKEGNAELQKLVSQGVNITEQSGKSEEAAINNNTDKVKKAVKKHKNEVEKIYGEDTIKGLQQRISKLNEVMETSSFGGEKYNKAKAQKSVYEERLENLTRNFDDEIAEIKRQTEVRDKLLQAGYSKETVDAMFPKVADKSYKQILEDTSTSLQNLINTGNGTKETAVNLKAVNDELDRMNNIQSKMDFVTERIDTLNNKFSGTQLLDKLEESRINSLKNSTEQEKVIINKAYDDARELAIKAQQDKFNALLEEQRTYEEKSLALQKEYEDVKNSDLYKNASDSDKGKIDDSFKDRFGALDAEMIKSTAEWQVAFGELEGMTNTSLQVILNRLLEFQAKTKGTLSLQDSAELQKAIDNVNNAANKNPFQKLTFNFSNYRTTLQASRKAQDEYNRVLKETPNDAKKVVDAGAKMVEADKKALEAKKKLISQLQESQDIFNAVGNGIKELGDAFGGFDDATNDAIGNIMEIGNAAFDLGKSISSGDVAGMISAGIKLIGSIGKALSGDQKKERNIKRQAAQLKELEMAYNNLAFAAERAFGSQKYSGQRDLIQNLEQQKAVIQGMMNTENSKKKKDQEKINGYKAQINSINQSIAELKEGIIKDVLQTDIPDMASKLGDALLEAFSKGESGVEAINKAFDDLVKNMLKNQLNKILEGQMSGVIANMRTAMGFNADGSGAFDGLTEQEIADLRAQVQSATAQGQQFIDAYSQIFGDLASPAEGLKGDIKGITEKTAGALEAQINAIRIYQVEALNVHRANQLTFIQSLQNLVQIEFNTRNLIQIRQDISEMNSKMAKGLAGIG